MMMVGSSESSYHSTINDATLYLYIHVVGYLKYLKDRRSHVKRSSELSHSPAKLSVSSHVCPFQFPISTEKIAMTLSPSS